MLWKHVKRILGLKEDLHGEVIIKMRLKEKKELVRQREVSKSIAGRKKQYKHDSNVFLLNSQPYCHRGNKSGRL